MKFRKVLIALIGVILVAVLGFSFFANRSVNLLVGVGVEDNPKGVVFVPKQSPLMVSVLINPQQLDSFVKFLPTNGEFKQVAKAMDKLRSTLLTQAQVNSIDDLKGWIDDEVTFAVTSLDYDHNNSNGTQPGYLLAVKHNDSQAANEFLQTYYVQDVLSDTSELIFDEYEGVNIVYQHPFGKNSPIKQVAAGVVGDYVLFANDLPVLIDAINNVQAVELNLENDIAYQESLEVLPTKKVGVVYLNLPTTSAWITNKAQIADTSETKSLTLSLQLDGQGLIANTAFFGPKDEAQLEAEANEEKNTLNEVPSTLAFVPENSALAVAGVNLQALAEDLNQGLNDNNPFSQILAQIIKPIESSLDLDFQSQIFDKVTGEYAFSFSQNKERKSLDWFFIDEVTDEPLTTEFDSIAQNRGLSIGSLPLDDRTMTTWTKLITTSDRNYSSLEAQVKGVHAQKESYEIITSSVDLLSNSLSESPYSLLDNNAFQTSVSALPQENYGYLYLKWQPLKPYLTKRFPLLRVVELGFKPLFDNLNSLTLTSQGVENGIERSTVFFNFGK